MYIYIPICMFRGIIISGYFCNNNLTVSRVSHTCARTHIHI